MFRIKTLPFVTVITCGLIAPASAQTTPDDTVLIPYTVNGQGVCDNHQLTEGAWKVTFPNSDKLFPFSIKYLRANPIIDTRFSDEDLQIFKSKTPVEQRWIRNRTLQITEDIVNRNIKRCKTLEPP